MITLDGWWHEPVIIYNELSPDLIYSNILPSACTWMQILIAMFSTYSLECRTSKNATIGAKDEICHFPFKYKNRTYYTCTYEDSSSLTRFKPWCSVNTGFKDKQYFPKKEKLKPDDNLSLFIISLFIVIRT